MKTNIIFLDIDGVLNGYNFWNQLGWKLSCLFGFEKWYKKHTKSPFSIHPEKVARLAKIVYATNSKIVMSSSWKPLYWNIPYKELTPDKQKLHDELQRFGIEIIDVTPKLPDKKREDEINAWLSLHKSIVKNFVVIDDERYSVESFVGTHLVQTSSVKKGQIIKGHWYENTGLKHKHIKQAIHILQS